MAERLRSPHGDALSGDLVLVGKSDRSTKTVSASCRCSHSAGARDPNPGASDRSLIRTVTVESWPQSMDEVYQESWDEQLGAAQVAILLSAASATLAPTCPLP